MNLYSPQTDTENNRNWYTIIKLILFAGAFFLLFSFIGYQIYIFFHRSQTDIYLSRKKSFSILIYGYGDTKKNLNHISSIIINPKTKRIGIISFYPQTRFTPNDLSLQEKFFKNDKNVIKKEISRLLNIKPQYEIEYNINDLAKALDLMEGIHYFLPEIDLILDENVPSGEFTMDGDIVRRYLNIENKNGFSPALILFRYYSLALNIWENKEKKWRIIGNQSIFNLLTSGLKTNLSQKELLSLAKNLSLDKTWVPIFIEIPLKREKDFFYIDVDSTALFVKKLMNDIDKKENPFLENEPRIEIKNGTMVPNLAKKMRYKIARKGLKVLEFSNADHHQYEKSILIDVNANYYYLQSVSKLLNIKKIYHSVNKTHFTDLIFIVGKDYKELGIE